MADLDVRDFEAMPNAEYLAIQQRVELIARLILDTDPRTLAVFIRVAERADTLGPFMDPTAWVAARDSLVMVLAHARAVAAARKSIAEAATRAGVDVPHSSPLITEGG